MLNAIKSQLIMKIIFENIKNKRKLKVIKYSNYLKNKLNISIKNYETYELLKVLNVVLDRNIEDIDIDYLGFYHPRNIQGILKFLSKIEFKELACLNISYNKIRSIDALEKYNFKKLQVLNLSHNIIRDISVLEKTEFKELTELDLCCNEIYHLDVLQNANFKKMKILNLRNNKISNIDVLE